MSIVNDNNEQLFDIHCVAEETDILRNGGVEDITRIIVDQSKIITDEVNVIVKGKITKRDSVFQERLVYYRSIGAHNSSCILSKFK